MARKTKKELRNWVLKKKDGTETRFMTYADAWNTKRDNPDYERCEDIQYLPVQA